jgi:tetratricopeptide (TPR) repeat protein
MGEKDLDMLIKAIELRKEGKLEEARMLLENLLTKEPENPELLYQLASVHDAMGLEKEAAPLYEKALRNGLKGESRKGALLGLGSTYRTLGQYMKAKETLERGMEEFPEASEFEIFYSMVLYNLGNYSKAMEILLKKIAEVSNDPGIQQYKKAIHFYSDKLDQTWN